jgi:hypothetical protein
MFFFVRRVDAITLITYSLRPPRPQYPPRSSQISPTMCASNDNHAGISNSPSLVQIHLPATANTRVMQKAMLSGSCYYDTRRCTERWRCLTLYLLRRARRSPYRRVAIPNPKSTWTGFLLTVPRPNQKPVFPSRSLRKCREFALTLFWVHSKN